LSLDSLLSTDPAERERALLTLTERADASAVDLIGRSLLVSSWPVCDQLAQALASIGGESATKALVQALRGRRHHIRSAAIKALMKVGGEAARDEIAKLANDPSFAVRQDAAQALCKLDGF